MNWRQLAAAGAFIAFVAPTGSAFAAPKPMVLSATLTPPVAVSVIPEPVCTVRVREIQDLRSDPGMIGVYMGKAVKAPEDRDLWLSNMLGQLRYFRVRVLTADEALDETVPEVAVFLEKAWVTNAYADVAASVVLRADEVDAAGTVSQVRFRGTQQKTTYWTFGIDEGKIQRGLDSASSMALEQLASHLISRCGLQVH
jgi:hypothetical protein